MRIGYRIQILEYWCIFFVVSNRPSRGSPFLRIPPFSYPEVHCHSSNSHPSYIVQFLDSYIIDLYLKVTSSYLILSVRCICINIASDLLLVLHLSQAISRSAAE